MYAKTPEDINKINAEAEQEEFEDIELSTEEVY
jgi:hypothetical protein